MFPLLRARFLSKDMAAEQDSPCIFSLVKSVVSLHKNDTQESAIAEVHQIMHTTNREKLSDLNTGR